MTNDKTIMPSDRRRWQARAVLEEGAASCGGMRDAACRRSRQPVEDGFHAALSGQATVATADTCNPVLDRRAKVGTDARPGTPADFFVNLLAQDRAFTGAYTAFPRRA